MKIDGIDPLVADQLREHSSRRAVKPAEGAQFDQKIREGDRSAEKVFPTAGSKKAEALDRALQKLNDTARAFQLRLRFQKHQASNRWIVRVVDPLDDQVLREIPPEQVLNIVAQIQDLIGILLDEQC